MSDLTIMQRIQRGSPGIRVILVPKQEMIEKIGVSTFPRGAAAVAQEVRNVAERFNTAVEPALKNLEKIGLDDVTGVDLKKKDLAIGVKLQSPNAGMYERLSLVRAVAVRLQDDTKIGAVLDAAHEDFDVVLDVRTDSDQPFLNEPTVRRGTRQAWPLAAIGDAWDRNIRGTGVLVGVLDTGIDADHTEFKGKRVEFRYFPPSAVDGKSSRNVRGFDTDGHGTHVCGIIAGKRYGLTRDVNLHVASVIESETLRASLWRTVYGLDWMFRLFIEQQYVNVPCVINLSLCFFDDQMTAEEVGDWRLVLGRAVEDLHRKDALVIAAAGNRGVGLIGFPANFDNVLAVGAVDAAGGVADFSGIPTPHARRDIYGYGVNVYSALERTNDGKSHFISMNGTSMAAPYVTGIASMLRQTRPGASAHEVRDHLLQTALDAGGGVRIARFVHWPGGVP